MEYPKDFVNKVICGNSFEVMRYIPDESIDLILTDPPYLATNEKWDKQEVVNDKLSEELFRIAKNHCSLYVWCGIGEKSQSLIRWFPIFSKYWYFKDLITWKKQKGTGMRKGWICSREEIMWFVKNNKNFIWNKEEQYDINKFVGERRFGFEAHKRGYRILSKYKRFSNVWDNISEVSWNWKDRPKHPTPKPLEALKRIIKLHTKENDVVLDLFMGSGTTGVACKELRRNFIGIEIDPEYCKIAENRIADITNKKSEMEVNNV